jgi:hypothetical protein
VPVAAWSLAGLFAARSRSRCWATIGVAVGVVVRHQVAAIVGSRGCSLSRHPELDRAAHRCAGCRRRPRSGGGHRQREPAGRPPLGCWCSGAWTAGAIALAATVVERRDVV